MHRVAKDSVHRGTCPAISPKLLLLFIMVTLYTASRAYVSAVAAEYTAV